MLKLRVRFKGLFDIFSDVLRFLGL